MTLHLAAPSRTALRRVARQVEVHSRHLTLREALGTGPHGIAESLDLWVVDRDAIRSVPDTSTMDQIARPTGRWHHQIVDGKRNPVAFSRSSRHAGAMGENATLARSPLSRAVMAGLKELARRRLRRDATVRLLEIPSQLVEALWIVPDAPTTPGRLLVLSAPPHLRLSRKRLITARALIAAVRKQASTST
jgi:hypothetical protein